MVKNDAEIQPQKEEEHSNPNKQTMKMRNMKEYQ